MWPFSDFLVADKVRRMWFIVWEIPDRKCEYCSLLGFRGNSLDHDTCTWDNECAWYKRDTTFPTWLSLACYTYSLVQQTALLQQTEQWKITINILRMDNPHHPKTHTHTHRHNERPIDIMQNHPLHKTRSNLIFPH